MKKVVNLTTKNTKGIDISESLTGREIYLGPNGIGKSARLEALIIGLQGYLPWLGKTPESTFQIASDDTVSVNLSCDSGFSFGRTVRRKTTNHKDGSKSYKYQTSCSVFPDEGEGTDTEKLKRITDEVGNFSIMFDLDEFLKMSDDKKRAFIFQLSSPESHGWSKERVLEELSAFKTLIEPRWDDTKTISDNISDLYAQVASEHRDARAVKKDKDAAKVEIIKMRQQLTDEATQDVIDLEAQLKELRQQKTSMTRDVSKAEQAAESHKKIMAKIENNKEAKIALSHKVPADVSLYEDHLAQQQKSLAVIQDHALQSNVRLKNILATEKKLTKQISDADIEIAQKDERNKIREIITTIDKVGCPLLGSDCSSDLAGYKVKLEARWQENDDLIIKTLRPDRDKLILELGRCSKDLSDAQKEVKALEVSEKANLKMGRNVERKISEAKQSNRDTETTQTALDREESNLKDLLRDSPAAIDTTVAKRTLEAMDNQIDGLEKEKKKAEEVKNIMLNFENANVAAEEAKEKVEQLDKLYKALGPTGIQSSIMNDVIGPISKTVNKLLAYIPAEGGGKYSIKINLLDMNGKETFEIIRPTANGDIPYNSLSGGQQILFGTALVTALILLENPPVKALCIEAAELDSGSFFRLIDALDNIGKDIDNIMIASCSDDVMAKSSNIKNWNCVHLS